MHFVFVLVFVFNVGVPPTIVDGKLCFSLNYAVQCPFNYGDPAKEFKAGCDPVATLMAQLPYIL